MKFVKDFFYYWFDLNWHRRWNKELILQVKKAEEKNYYLDYLARKNEVIFQKEEINKLERSCEEKDNLLKQQKQEIAELHDLIDVYKKRNEKLKEKCSNLEND